MLGTSAPSRNCSVTGRDDHADLYTHMLNRGPFAVRSPLGGVLAGDAGYPRHVARTTPIGYTAKARGIFRAVLSVVLSQVPIPSAFGCPEPPTGQLSGTARLWAADYAGLYSAGPNCS